MKTLAVERIAIVVAATGLAGCIHFGPSKFTPPKDAICAASSYSVDTSFASGGIHDCVIAPDGSVVVSVDHEPAVHEGINPSPWFAFRLKSDAPRNVTVTLDYTDYTHRYAPHLSTDGKTWTALGADRLTLNERKTRATLKLDLLQGGVVGRGPAAVPLA